MIQKIQKIRTNAFWGNLYLTHPDHLKGNKLSLAETQKSPLRHEVINFIIGLLDKKETCYLEIGVRNPEDNFNKIHATVKYSVDPGVEFKENPVDFKVTSDEFFDGLRSGRFISPDVKFDIIFIDGLHLADQVERDIENALAFIEDSGFVILHDCNPPTESHARESYSYAVSPAMGYWNGTTWKAFFKYRQNKNVYSCCIDSDWGIGIISKKINIGSVSSVANPFYEFHVLNDNRKDSLNLISFEEFKRAFV